MNAETAKLIRKFATKYERIIGRNRDAMLKQWWNALGGVERGIVRERMRAANDLVVDPRNVSPEGVRASQRVLAVLRPSNPEPRVAQEHGRREWRHRAAKAIAQRRRLADRANEAAKTEAT